MSSLTSTERIFRLWSRLLIFAVVAILIAILFLDGPIAGFFRHEVHMSGLRPYAPSSHLISIAALVAGILIGLVCLFTKRFPKWAEAVLLSAVAAIASIHVAGRITRLADHPGPRLFVHYLRNHFGWHGQNLGFDAFPSTHAALAAAGLSVWTLYFPRAGIACLAGALVIDVLLVAGGWHYVSDVLAGNMLGFTIAVLGCGGVEALKAQRHARMRVT
jgi:membrane-associated phospholipid phosphatase